MEVLFGVLFATREIEVVHAPHHRDGMNGFLLCLGFEVEREEARGRQLVQFKPIHEIRHGGAFFRADQGMEWHLVQEPICRIVDHPFVLELWIKGSPN